MRVILFILLIVSPCWSMRPETREKLDRSRRQGVETINGSRAKIEVQAEQQKVESPAEAPAVPEEERRVKIIYDRQKITGWVPWEVYHEYVVKTEERFTAMEVQHNSDMDRLAETAVIAQEAAAAVNNRFQGFRDFMKNGGFAALATLVTGALGLIGTIYGFRKKLSRGLTQRFIDPEVIRNHMTAGEQK